LQHEEFLEAIEFVEKWKEGEEEFIEKWYNLSSP